MARLLRCRRGRGRARCGHTQQGTVCGFAAVRIDKVESRSNPKYIDARLVALDPATLAQVTGAWLPESTKDTPCAVRGTPWHSRSSWPAPLAVLPPARGLL